MYKIAFCFSWQARTLDQTYLFFKKNLFDAAKEQWFDYDVFCAVEDDKDIWKVQLLSPTKIFRIKSGNSYKTIKQKYRGLLYKEYNRNYMKILYTSDERLLNLQQLYKINESIKLKNQYEKEKNIKYNIVFKLRFDLIFKRKLNYKKILNKIVKDVIICNEYVTLRNKFYAVEDLYFIWNSDTIQQLSRFYDLYDDIINWVKIWKYKFIYIISKILEYSVSLLNNIWFSYSLQYRLSEKCKLSRYAPELLLWSFFYQYNIPLYKTTISVYIHRKDETKDIIIKRKKSEFEL